ncbi:hypothetical protein BV898_11099 [Hypsibius exemplaris]|uniref:Uncharacterized protein n=1 Tax=Hypsibius exemplaris TaxID=2072580 RepID=A0A1W0WHR5_HYPEX|nr:hypothetical protein BV898_11099 [Hypsibius exemplaris]
MCGAKDKTRIHLRRVWSYAGQPVGKGSWNSISEFKALQCEYEDVVLEQDCPTCLVLSVVGEVTADRKTGYVVHGHRTFVWKDLTATHHSCEVTRLPPRMGQLFNDSGVLRVRDPASQMDFVLGPFRSLKIF